MVVHHENVFPGARRDPFGPRDPPTTRNFDRISETPTSPAVRQVDGRLDTAGSWKIWSQKCCRFFRHVGTRRKLVLSILFCIQIPYQVVVHYEKIENVFFDRKKSSKNIFSENFENFPNFQKFDFSKIRFSKIFRFFGSTLAGVSCSCWRLG